MATVIPQNTATNVTPQWNYGTADAPVTVQAPSNDPMLTKNVINQANSLGFNAADSGMVTAARNTGVAPKTYDTATGNVATPTSASQAIAQGIKQTPVSPLAASTPTVNSTVTPTAGTGLVSGKTAISPLGTTPTTQTGVSTTQNAVTGQTGGIDDATFNTILRSIDPNSIYTNEQKKSLRDTLSQSTANTAKSLDLQTTGAKTALEEYKGIADAWRMQRNIVDQMDTNNIMNQRQVQDLTRQYTIAKDNQKNRMEADANNMSVMQGSTGRLSSRNMMNAVHQVLDENDKVYNDLVSQQDIMTKRLAEDLDMATKTLSKAYNDAVSDDMQKALHGINALDSTGAMNTKAGLIQARSVIDGMLQNRVTNLNSYYQGLNTLNEKYKTYQAEATAQKKVDQELTKTMNDGYMYNANGTKIVNESGVPLTYNPQKQIEGTLKNEDGSTTILYKDGTHETQQFGGTVGTEAVAGYAQLVSQGRLSLNDVPASIRNNVAMQASQMPQAGQWEFTNITDADGNTRTVQYNKTTNEIRDPTTGQTIPMGASGLTGASGQSGGFGNIAKMTAMSESGADYGRVSSGKGDAGGVSYGAYQLSSTRGSAQAFIDTMGYSNVFSGMKPGTPAFSAKWKEMAQDKNFQDAQDQYAQQTYYEPFKEKLENNGISVGNRSDGVQALLFSTSNQYGKNTNVVNDFVKSVGGKDAVNNMSDQEFIKKFSQYKIDTVNSYFKSSSQDVRNGVVNRFRREQNQAMEQANQPTTEINPAAGSIKDAFAQAGVDPMSSGVTTQQYTPSQKNLFEGYAKKVSDGTLTLKDRNSIANQLGVKPNELDNVYNQYVDSVSNAPKAPINVASLPLYKKYVEDGTLPSKDALKGLGMTSEQFVDSAGEGYDKFLREKENEINSVYPTLNIEFTPSYNNISATQKEKLNESLTKIGDIDQRIGQLKKLFEENGTEVWPTKAKSVMETLRKQIILKAKEVENLGVLNGPDLGILENLLPGTTGAFSGMFSFDKNTLAKLDNIQENYRSDAKTKGINYGAKISFGDKKLGIDSGSVDLQSVMTGKQSPITTSSGFKFNPGATAPSNSVIQPDEASQLDSIF